MVHRQYGRPGEVLRGDPQYPFTGDNPARITREKETEDGRRENPEDEVDRTNALLPYHPGTLNRFKKIYTHGHSRLLAGHRWTIQNNNVYYIINKT